MKNTLEVLNKLSKVIDLNLFYVVTIYNDDIKLQGKKEKFKEVNEVFKTPRKLTNEGWFYSQHEFEGAVIAITLT